MPRHPCLLLLLLLLAALLPTLPCLLTLNLRPSPHARVSACEMMLQNLPTRLYRLECKERNRDGVGRVHDCETGVFEDQDAFLCCAGVAAATVQKVVVSWVF